VVASLAIALFMLIYLWAQYVAAGKTVAVMFQASYPDSNLLRAWSYPLAVVLSAGVITLYTFQGGYRALLWTDALQAVMMLTALVVLPAVCFAQLGGWDGLAAALDRASAEAAAAGPPLAETGSHLQAWFAGLVGLILFTFLFEDAGVGAGYLGQPHISVRFMAIQRSSELRPAFIVSILFSALVCAGAVAVGLVAHGWFRFTDVPAGHADDLRQFLADPEQVLPLLAVRVLPPWLAGFILSAIMAAIMSTASGFLLSVTSSMTEDVYHRVARPAAGERELVHVSRLVTLALGVGALVLALTTDPFDPQATVYRLVLYGWAGLAGCFAAPLVLALFYPGMTRAGCLAGMVVGAVTILVWHNVPALAGVAYEIIPAMLLSAAAIVVVSRFTGPLAAATAGPGGTVA
jgi:SSS family transporter